MKIGLCPACEGDQRILANDTIRQHDGPDNVRCPGSYKPPAAVLPLTFRRWLATQTNRRGHGQDLAAGTLARTAPRYGDTWVTPNDLADAMGAANVDPNSRIVRYLADAAAEFNALAGAAAS